MNLGLGQNPLFPSGRRRSPSSERRVSRRRSRSPPSVSTRAGEDDWTKTTDAFLNNLSKPRGDYASPPQAYQRPNMGVPPPPMLSRPRDEDDVERRSSDRRQRKSRSKSKGKKKSRARSRSDSSSSSVASDPEDRSKLSGESPQDEIAKLQSQNAQYQEARDKLEDQLIKLKEQREALKEGGAKHEDIIMKENARIQKEVKNRIQKMNGIMEQLKADLNEAESKAEIMSSRGLSLSPVPKKPRKPARSKSPSPEQREPESKKTRNRKRDHRSSSVEEERERNGKKKKKKKAKDRSSSEEDSEVELERKRKKKKKARSRKNSSSSSDSDSEEDKRRKRKESVEPSSKRAESSKGSTRTDETMVELLAKMSDAFMKCKQDCKELKARVGVLEAENLVLKKQAKEFKVREEQQNHEEEASKQKTIVLQKAHLLLLDDHPIPKKDINSKQILANLEDQRQKEKGSRLESDDPRSPKIIQEDPKASPKTDRVDRRSSPKRDREARRSSPRRDREDRRSSPKRDRENRRGSPKRDREDRYTSSRRDYRSKRDVTPPPRRTRRESPPPPAQTKPDRNDKIDLDEWTSRPEEKSDPGFDSIRAKVKEKVDRISAEEKKSQWATIYEPSNGKARDSEPEPERAKTPEELKLPEGPRAHVALQWGTHSKKATSPVPGGKKANVPVIGKMPGRGKRSSITPQRVSAEPEPERRKSKFGPKVDNVPPPTTVVTHPPNVGITPEMYMQAITATMPSEAPPPENPRNPSGPPKNPVPQTVDIGSILAAARQHIQSKRIEIVRHPPVPKEAPEMYGVPCDIPLPPLPAALDKDAMASLDTRPPRPITPPPPVQKTELDFMMEKHASKEAAIAKKEAVAEKKPEMPPQKKANPFETNTSDMDPDELAMLGIDPNDLAGFGS
eukprot:maker-scaffold203_size261420-snap-gene-0.11 protein:Tk10405 transcript:maker-scaffold203_size261420-snap-gene-0.11-mRNA-1 annotation:"---NA---"